MDPALILRMVGGYHGPCPDIENGWGMSCQVLRMVGGCHVKY